MSGWSVSMSVCLSVSVVQQSFSRGRWYKVLPRQGRQPYDRTSRRDVIGDVVVSTA